MIKINILMPIYNGIEFIEESVSSIKNQTYQNWELIIGINGHSINSEIYQKAASYKSEKIKVYDLVDVKGKSNALNKMLEHCDSEWVCLLDVDDKWDETKLEKQIPYTDSFDVIGTKCRYFGDKNGQPGIPEGDISDFNFFRVNPIINSSCMVKKELCFWEEEILEDYDMWLRLRKEGKRFYNLSEVLVSHRIHNQSAFNSKGNHLKVRELLKKHKNI